MLKNKRHLKKQENDKRYLWRLDKTTKQYAKYLKKRKKAMIESTWKRLTKLNKKTPIEYKHRLDNK